MNEGTRTDPEQLTMSKGAPDSDRTGIRLKNIMNTTDVRGSRLDKAG